MSPAPEPSREGEARVLWVVWIALIALTLGSYRLSMPGVAAAAGASAWLIGVAALKGHLIAGVFMELRRGPLVWAVLMSGFLVAEAALVIAILP